VVLGMLAAPKLPFGHFIQHGRSTQRCLAASVARLQAPEASSVEVREGMLGYRPCGIAGNFSFRSAVSVSMETSI